MATTLYLTRRSHGVVMDGRYPGGWNATSIGERLHGQVDYVYRLRDTKTNGGSIGFTNTVGETTDTPDWDLAIASWITDPLDVDQTISGTLDWVLGAYASIAGSEVQWFVHAYVMAGDDTQTSRGTLVSGAVAPDATIDATARFRGPSGGAQALTPVNGVAGDRVAVIVGFRFVNADPADDVTIFNTTARLYFGTMHSGQTIEGADGSLGGTSVTTQCGFLTFSQTLTFAAAVAPPAHDACADAITITTLPYHAPRVDTTESTDTERAVWYTYTPAADATLILTGLGSNYDTTIRVHRGASCGALTFLGQTSGSLHSWVQRSATLRAQAVTGGETYWFEIRSGDAGGVAPGGGGSLTFSVTERDETLVDDDLYVDCQHIVVYRGGELIRFQTGFFNLTPTGNAIDTTLRALPDFNNPDHTSERLYVGLFGSDPLIEVLDLRTLAEVGYTYTPFDTPSPGNENISSLVFDRSGRVLCGWYGDNYDEIGALSTPAGCAVRRFDGLALDSEPPYDWTGAAASYTLTQEVGGTDFVELAVDQDTLWYTSAGRKILRYSLTSGQLADFVTLPVESGPRPGLRSTRLLPPGDGSGGLLVCDGINVKRLNAAGVVIQTYTPTPSVRAQDLDKVELTQSGETFWVSDQLSTSLFHFDLATGVQLDEIITGLPTGQLCGFSIYNGFRAGVAPPPEEPPPGSTPGVGCPTDFPVDLGGSGSGCPVPFFP